jgi:hypothetical protein
MMEVLSQSFYHPEVTEPLAADEVAIISPPRQIETLLLYSSLYLSPLLIIMFLNLKNHYGSMVTTGGPVF